VGGAGSCVPAVGERKRTTSKMSLPSGARTITTSTVVSSSPMIRSIHSPPCSAGRLQSKPSSDRKRTVSSRSSTTRPMWTKLVTPGIAVKTPCVGGLGGAQDREHGEHAAVVGAVVAEAELLEDVRDVLLDGVLADVQALGDAVVGEALDD
jgi:hypothetical protein